MDEMVGLRELRHNAAEWVRRAEAGERIAVTDRGRVVAEIGPPQSPANVRALLAARGELVLGRGGELPEPLPPREDASASDVLLQRDEGRW